EREESREARVGELDLALEPRAQQARQVALALRAIEWIARRLGPQDGLARALERAAEVAPDAAVGEPALCFRGHRALLDRLAESRAELFDALAQVGQARVDVDQLLERLERLEGSTLRLADHREARERAEVARLQRERAIDVRDR